MEIIRKLSEEIGEELEDAEKYAKLALLHQSTHPELAKTYYDLSTEEMHHVDMLHANVTRLIEKHRKEHGEPPVPMMAVYEYLHKMHIEEAAEVKIYQAQYREHM